MATGDRPRTDLLQGTLDLLILRTLRASPAHGHAIATHIQRTTDDVLRVQHGSLYPALHRLEEKGLIASQWQHTARMARPLKIYSLTAKGRKQLEVETSRWDTLVAAVARVLRPA
jgi:PadR family transcriptional regulator, regulatory protein PadR